VGLRRPGSVRRLLVRRAVIAGDRATVEYWAILAENGREVTIAGVALLRFDRDGRVIAQRDYWSLEKGGREPPEAWGT
jgi:hypothetical protein